MARDRTVFNRRRPFERHSRGMVMTAAGEVYFRYAQSVLIEGENTQLEIDALKGVRRGHVRVCSIEGLVSSPLFDAIHAFRQKYLKITFSLRASDNRAVMEAVRDGETDIGNAFQSSSMVGVRIAWRIANPLQAICHREHPIASRRTVTLQEVAAYPMAIPDRSFGIRHVLDPACHVKQIQTNSALESNSVEVLRAFAKSGSGLTVLPWLACKANVMAQRVVAVPIDDALLSASSVDICVRHERTLPPAVLEFLDEITIGLNFNPPEMTAGRSATADAAL